MEWLLLQLRAVTESHGAGISPGHYKSEPPATLIQN